MLQFFKSLIQSKILNTITILLLMILGLFNIYQLNIIPSNYAKGQSIPATTHTLVLNNPQQQIKGFGVSSVEFNYQNYGYNSLTQTQRAELDNPIFDNLKSNTMRYWGDISTFERDYTQQYNNIKNRTQYHLFQAYITDNNYNTESNRVAVGVKNLRNKNINLTHVSICNECSDIPQSAWPTLVISLKNALVSQGLNDVKIVAPEGPNNDNFWLDRVKEIKNNPTAWAALDVISSHSYSMAMRAEDNQFKLTSGKEWWIGETSDNGPEEVGDTGAASVSLARLIHDYNQGVDNWIWFIGHAYNDSGDNRTRILKYTQNPFVVQKLEKYYYFEQFRSLFKDGARIYNTVSSTENEMPWTYQNYAKLQATGAKNQDGTWSLAVTNPFSSSSESAKFRIAELASQNNLTFDIYRNNGNQRGVLTDSVQMVNGEVYIPGGVNPRELITLKSRPSGNVVSSSTPVSSVASSVTSSIASSATSSVTSSSTPVISSCQMSNTETKISGATPFGATPSYGNSPSVSFDKAFDGNVNSFFDYANPDGGYVGLDLGSAPKSVSKICFHTRPGFDVNGGALPSRVNGGQFQGSNDSQNFVNLATITSAEATQWYSLPVTNTTPFRYLRYMSPNGSYGNIAEVEFYTPIQSNTSSSVATSSVTSSTTSSMQVSPATLALKVNLQGAYSADLNTMTSNLKSKNLIPTAQPYNVSPWNYTGSESINNTTLTSTAVDWILVEFKNASGVVVAKKAGILKTNGNLINGDQDYFTLPSNLSTGNYNLFIRHRNHLAISTSNPISINTANGTVNNIDLTTNQNVKGVNQAMLSNGQYGLKFGNASGDQAITSLDRVRVRTAGDKSDSYTLEDINMDGVVTSLDRVLARLNYDSTEIM